MYMNTVWGICNIVGSRLSVGIFPQGTVERRDFPGHLARSESSTLAKGNLGRLT